MTEKLFYDPTELKRELKRHYISASESDLAQMQAAIGAENYETLYQHVPEPVRMHQPLSLPKELEYSELVTHMQELAQKNARKPSFLGHGLAQYRVPQVVEHVAKIRKLATAYTPYQPERSQGTLITHWLYQSCVAAITGFEAVSASLYERSTAMFEAIKTAQRLKRGTTIALVSDSIYAGDKQVLQTLAADTELELFFVPVDAETGHTDIQQFKKLSEKYAGKIAALVYPQVSSLGSVEPVDALNDFAHERQLKTIAVVDPMLMGEGGLKPPTEFGKNGADMFVGEGQGIAIGPNFGGPGLGMFGIRHTAANKNDVRQTAGRFVGKSKDENGRACFSVILSTREQHIRREKATSNICSNQAFIASLAGAAMLQRGGEGLRDIASISRSRAQEACKELTKFEGVTLAFGETPFFNEFVLKLPISAKDCIEKARQAGLHIGVDVSASFPTKEKNYLMLSFTDWQSENDMKKLYTFFKNNFEEVYPNTSCPTLPSEFVRKNKVEIPRVELGELKRYYTSLGEQNVSPDENIYALGSCTMKYNPYVNEFAANLPEFTDIHPEAPIADAQGCLEVMYQTQEYFKAITGLPGLTTQPVAGAQGELVGIKMFQAYHRANGDTDRKVILVPRTAHGTNPATATMAGFESRVVGGKKEGVVLIEAGLTGEINVDQVKQLVEEHGRRICGIMITNPNTSGILESNFKEVADLVHSVGGLVYMDGANMNAIAGWIDLNKLGVDAVHNNTHKTWTIPHGGGGPGDAFVAVSDKLLDFLPGSQVVKNGDGYSLETPKKTIGSFHRHHGNFAHKVRCYTYLRALGQEGVPRMSAVAVLAARYLYHRLRKTFPVLPTGSEDVPRMHEFILTLSKEMFAKAEAAGLNKSQVIPSVGKLFLDFGLHAPTVAFPEVYGLMIEPTECYTKKELDRFADIVEAIHQLADEHPEVLLTAPHFTPIDRVDEVTANRDLQFTAPVVLPEVLHDRISSAEIEKLSMEDIKKAIIKAHQAKTAATG